MCTNELLGDGESQARAPLFARPCRVGAVAPFEDPIVVLLGNPAAGIAHRHFNAPILRYRRYPDRAACRRMPERVVEEVGQYLAQRVGIGRQVEVIGDLALKRDLL